MASRTEEDLSRIIIIDPYWRGCRMDTIYRHISPFELEHLPPVRPSDTHTVLHHFPIRNPDTEPPKPLRGHLKWDADHVRLPCSPRSQYPVTAEDGNVTIDSRWEMIEKALLRPFANTRELEEAVLSYNTKYRGIWDFRALHHLFEEELEEGEGDVFFESLLPRIIRLALRLPELVPSSIPLLKQSQTHSVTLTQEQISCLLANAFLCTFPRRNAMKRKSEYTTYSSINFNRLFDCSGSYVTEKIKCFCHYFQRVCPTEQSSSNVPTGVVTFMRRSFHYSELPNWGECVAPFSAVPLHITAAGTIEDNGVGLLQVDFANKFLGGGVLGSGCVQEEIRFVVCPELMVTKLFIESLRPTEAVVISGCERYSNYGGYACSFHWTSNYMDRTPRDSSRRRQTHIVAIDALAFNQSIHQYREDLILRELNKAYVGFYHPLETPAPGIATGNWGCGAFGGDPRLKAIIQLMACAATGRPLVYYTFGNRELRDAVHKMHNFLIEQKWRVCDLWAVLKRFDTKCGDAKQLYCFICRSDPKKALKKLATQNLTEVHSRKGSIIQRIKPGTRHNVKDKEQRQRSSVPTEPLPSVEGSTSASTSNTGASKRQQDISHDLFASFSSPDSDDNGAGRNERPLLPSSNSQTSSHILISDDGDIDDQPMAPLGTATPQTKPKTSDGTESSSSSSTVEQKRSEPRQRTLLEMLDYCYTTDSTAKRPKT